MLMEMPLKAMPSYMSTILLTFTTIIQTGHIMVNCLTSAWLYLINRHSHLIFRVSFFKFWYYYIIDHQNCKTINVI